MSLHGALAGVSVYSLCPFSHLLERLVDGTKSEARPIADQACSNIC